MRTNYEAGHVCWDGNDVMGGRPTGVVRASFGYGSTLGHAAAIAALVRRYFVEEAHEEEEDEEEEVTGAAAKQVEAAAGAAAAVPASAATGHISGLWVYPIKSCPGFSPTCWPLGGQTTPCICRADALMSPTCLGHVCLCLTCSNNHRPHHLLPPQGPLACYTTAAGRWSTRGAHHYATSSTPPWPDCGPPSTCGAACCG